MMLDTTLARRPRGMSFAMAANGTKILLLSVRCSCCPVPSCDLADHRVGDPVEGENLSQDVPVPEQLLGDIEPDDGDARGVLLVLPVEVASVLQLDGANVLILRLDAADADARGVVGALRADATHLQLRARHRHHR